MPPQPTTPAVLSAACQATLIASTPGRVASDAVTELSGIAASRRTADVWWVHNDSGDSARVFAIGTNGRDLGTYVLGGASATDWEDIAVGPGPTTGVSYLYAADIGDNGQARPSITVYRVPEPPVDATATTPVQKTLPDVAALTFTYPDGAHDAEALIVDPTTRQLFIVTKELSGRSLVFRAPADLAPGSATRLSPVATLSLGLGGLVTGGDVTPAGDVVGLRTYGKVLLYPRAKGTPLAAAFSQKPCTGKTLFEKQGEAIGFTPRRARLHDLDRRRAPAPASLRRAGTVTSTHRDRTASRCQWCTTSEDSRGSSPS